MCGIAGILVNDPADLDGADLARLSTTLAHRGPDGEGIWISADRTAGLVHRRLAIIDTSDRSNQPMHSADGAHSIVFNGEIYNFLELRDQLEQLGSQFRSDGDTEVILAAWRHWGADMLERFNGMWALAIRDNVSGIVFLARDRFGIKPLLYARSDRRFAFASEMRALLALPWLDRQVDRNSARRLLFDPFSIEGGEQTLFSSIRRLPAGHMAFVQKGYVDVRRWWRTCDHLVVPPVTIEGQADRFRELFLDAVKLRMRSDVALGTCLSGGFDSSAITGAMAHVARQSYSHRREARDWRHAFISSCPGQSNDETPRALEMARFGGVIPHVSVFNDHDAVANIDKILEDLDDIYISLPTAPWKIYSELRRARIVVSLDGHGADELMGAYRQRGESLGFFLRNGIAWGESHSAKARAMSERAKIAMRMLQDLNFLRHKLFAPPRPLNTPFDNDDLPGEWGGMNRRLYQMFHVSVLPTILRNFDRISMAHGIEIRMPFMDWRLVTYVMSLPDSAKSACGFSKYVARKAMAGLIPDEIRLEKVKVGFNSPMPELMNGALRPWVNATLDRPNALFDEIVDTKSLRRKVKSLNEKSAWNWENSQRLWPYINLHWFLDRCV